MLKLFTNLDVFVVDNSIVFYKKIAKQCFHIILNFTILEQRILTKLMGCLKTHYHEHL